MNEAPGRKDDGCSRSSNEDLEPGLLTSILRDVKPSRTRLQDLL